MVEALVIVSVFATAVLSGILGMAGGMILMAILVSALSVSAAMMIHGAVQATSNGSRSWFLRRHVQWRILPPYLAGAGAAMALFTTLSLVPDAGIVLILVGLMPWLARATPHLKRLDMNHRATAVSCGALVTSAQLLAGASGPLLDMYYLNSSLNRYQVIASKAITQTIGHLLKLVYYGAVVGVTETLPVWFYAAAMLTAVAGTRVGTWLLEHIPEGHFRRVSGWVILTIATVCIARGLQSLLSG
ncbi:MAG: TSUP family transporter [Pseudomonadales bacterium]